MLLLKCTYTSVKKHVPLSTAQMPFNSSLASYGNKASVTCV